MTKTERKKLNKKAKGLKLLAERARNKESDEKGAMLKALFDQQQIEAELYMDEVFQMLDEFDKGPALTQDQRASILCQARGIAKQVFNEVLHHIQGTTFGQMR